jgi:hypothetical protein
VLREVRTVVGDAKLYNWCFDELRIALPVIMRYRDLLTETDDQIVKDELAAATAVEKKEREEAKFQAALEKARKAKLVAEAKAEAARAKAASKVEVARLNTEKKKVEDTEKDRQRKRASNTERGPAANAKRRRREFTSGLSDVTLAELEKRFAAADKVCTDSLISWTEGSITKALVLAAAREKLRADQDFGAWVDRFSNARKPSVQDRAALVSLGRLGEARLREILMSTESRSYQLIWEKNKPKLELVEDEAAVS